MNSKKKNKNRQNKPSNPIPLQKQEVSESSSQPQVINAEVVESAVAERVPNIISGNVTAEVKQPDETPKKPKRNRGKKKSEDDKSDKEEEVTIEDPVKEVQPNKYSHEETNITPAARKKKNKNKKCLQSIPVEKPEESEDVDKVQLEERNLESKELSLSNTESEKEMKSAKRKNKKKKSRNDSERSDKTEKVSCTSAFQKLRVEEVPTETVSKSSTHNLLEATVKEDKVIPPADISTKADSQETLQNLESNKNMKNNKKDKKQPPNEPKVAKHIHSSGITGSTNVDVASDVCNDTSEPIVKEVEKLDEIEESNPSPTADDKNIKSKAKIAKPVEKKKKGKGNEKLPKDTPEDNVSSEIKPEVNVAVTSTENVSLLESSAPVITALNDDLDDIILVPLTEMTPDWLEEVKIEEKNGPIIGCEEKTEKIGLDPSNVKIEKNKNKQKSPKHAKKMGMATSPELATRLSEPGPSFLETSSSSKEQAELEHPLEVNSEEMVQNLEDKIEHIQDVHDDDISDVNKVIPLPSTRDEVPLGSEGNAETLREIDLFDETKEGSSGNSTKQIKNELEEKLADKLETKIHDKVTSSAVKSEQVIDNDKRKNRKKTPKSQKNNDIAIDPLMPSEVAQSDITHIDEKTLPVATNLDLLSSKTQELSEMKPECTQTPDSEKTKFQSVVDIEVASGSKCSQQLKKNLKMEDIILTEPEVVSDEKRQQSEIFTVCGDVDNKQDTIQINEDKRGSDRSKRRKQSPKLSEGNITKERRRNTHTVCRETHGDVQMPVTSITPDTNLYLASAVELQTPQIDPVSSPLEVTPDCIEYPRCSSEHLDSNNNMVIQEITHSDEALNVSLVTSDTPLIQSTNINSPELVTSAIKVTKIELDAEYIEGKTDLKSKVMEVNQDMEELRLSIERSLAELTSLEKTDGDVEKQIQEENIPHSKSNKKVYAKLEAPAGDTQTSSDSKENASSNQFVAEANPCQVPICPARKDHKGKGKSKKKSKQEVASQSQPAHSSTVTTDSVASTQSQELKMEDTNKSEQNSGDTQNKEKKQTSTTKENKDDDLNGDEKKEKKNHSDSGSIVNFEDVMTSSSVDDINRTFEMIANEANPRPIATQNNPEINVIAPQEDDKEDRQDKQNPVSPPKNLLGHPDIPVQSSRTDYKKEKNKPPNHRQAKVKIKDANHVQILAPEKSKQSKESQTESNRKQINYKKQDESICVTNQNDDYVYKYSFRKVFLQCACHVCKKDLNQIRLPCGNCNLIFYCSQKHKDEDYPQHKSLCFAVSTIVHLKDQKFIYEDARDVTGHYYRLLRMQMIVSCEKVMKRRLAPWEQEALLYPRMCGLSSCREWRQGKLEDCEGCGQISYCSEHPDHLPKTHPRWCKSYNLYRALVKHQQTVGRLEPKLPTKIVDLHPLPDNINEVLAYMYEEKIDMSDIEYAALTQLATAPLTALFCLQHKNNNANGITQKSILTLHIVGAELQFEADALNKWEVFLLHLLPVVKELRVVLVGPDLNPSNLPLELLGKIKLCENCQWNNRRVVFGFQDKRTYHDFWASDDFTAPDMVCAFNPSIQRSYLYRGKDTWPLSINCILKLRIPFAITSYTLSELTSDLLRIQECATVGYNIVCAPRNNIFSSVRPDRNFISDDEAPLLFKNHCVTVVCGV